MAMGPMFNATLLVGCVPAQPSDPVPPLAVQEVALAVTHVSSVEPPVRIAFGVASNSTTDAAGAVTFNVALLLALPPAPMHVNVNE